MLLAGSQISRTERFVEYELIREYNLEIPAWIPILSQLGTQCYARGVRWQRSKGRREGHVLSSGKHSSIFLPKSLLNARQAASSPNSWLCLFNGSCSLSRVKPEWMRRPSPPHLHPSSMPGGRGQRDICLLLQIHTSPFSTLFCALEADFRLLAQQPSLLAFRIPMGFDTWRTLANRRREAVRVSIALAPSLPAKG